MASQTAQVTTAEHFERRTVRKVTVRIIPLLFLMYIVNYIDRANIGYASLHMNTDLGLTSQAFGLAAGLFFIGYFVCEVPSNILLEKFGARRWIARILLTRGTLAVIMGFVQNEWQLYALRFLLGVSEAGFFPGIMVYLGQWFREKDKATATGLFVASVPASYIVAAPMSTWIMDHITWGGLSGWRWMFILEGIPAVMLGVVCLMVLTETPRHARWLTEKEKTWLTGELEAEEAARRKAGAQHLSIWKTLANPKVIYLGIIYLVYQIGSLGVGYWLPTIIGGFSDNLSTVQVGLIGMLPYIVATVVMVWWSHRSDVKQERQFHSWFPMGIAALAMFAAAVFEQPVLVMVAITVSLAGLYTFKSPFWAVPAKFLSAATAGTAIAAVNSLGNLGGFIGPYAQGAIVDATGSTKIGLLFFAALLVGSTVMMMTMRLNNRNSGAEDSHAEASTPVLVTAPGQPELPACEGAPVGEAR